MAAALVRVSDALTGVRRVFLDTAPVVYAVEGQPAHLAVLDGICPRIREGPLTAVTSPVTLAENLVGPFRLGLGQLRRDDFAIITSARHTEFRAIDGFQALRAVSLRATHKLTMTDALQVAAALSAG